MLFFSLFSLQKIFFLISAVLAAAQADVSHLAGNSLETDYGYVYAKPNNPLVYPEEKSQPIEPVRKNFFFFRFKC